MKRFGLVFAPPDSNKAPMGDYAIREDDLTGEQVAALLRLHLDDMPQWSPPESVHALPIEPARRLYESHGFAECPPFGDYLDDGFSLCMTRTL